MSIITKLEKPYPPINQALAKKAFVFTEKRFVKHATAIGQAILAWNYLHERLGAIFDTNAKTPIVGRSIDAWYSTNMDRARRELLRAMVREPDPRSRVDEWLKKRIEYSTEVRWILSECDKLEDTRNGIVHAPLFFLDPSFARQFYWDYDDDKPSLKRKSGIVPYDVTGNPRAKRLSDKDLLIEYRWFRDTCMVLAEYCRIIDRVWTHMPPLPGRPPLPTREHQKSRQGQKRRPRETK